jgi:hypothetical protein
MFASIDPAIGEPARFSKKENRAARARQSFADQGTTGNHLPEGNS